MDEYTYQSVHGRFKRKLTSLLAVVIMQNLTVVATKQAITVKLPQILDIDGSEDYRIMTISSHAYNSQVDV